ncbi:hypothetical protein QOZ80_5BG0428480 [Eleusine coracana subsp. coracana]|nr:hypothetical protein QOZ80_5BG0428480 [Eleusine coracana subsp. coracana]
MAAPDLGPCGPRWGTARPGRARRHRHRNWQTPVEEGRGPRRRTLLPGSSQETRPRHGRRGSLPSGSPGGGRRQSPPPQEGGEAGGPAGRRGRPVGRNALHFASAKGHIDICRFLIEDGDGPGLDVNSRSAEGDTPVFIATTEGHLPVLRYLLDRGGDPAMPDARGVTPLHRAAKNGPCDAVRLLLNKGVPVEPLANRWTPLHFAITGRQFQALKILLDHGADPDRINHNLCTPVMMGISLRSLECIKMLVQAGADVNSTTPYGQTALTHAVDACLPDFEKLNEIGADPNYHGEEVLDDRLADWNVDAIIRTMKVKAKGAVSVELEEHLCTSKSKGREAFRNGDYLAATFFYGQAISIDPLDATLFANRSVCFLRLEEGESALMDAQRCRMMRPRWAKAWYRQGAALSLLKRYKEAAHSFEEALKLDPASDEIKNAHREAMQAMGSCE